MTEGKSPLHGSIVEAGVPNSSRYWPVLCTPDFCGVEDALGQVILLVRPAVLQPVLAQASLFLNFSGWKTLLQLTL